ncbi:MAG: hypothetical protein WD971_14405 [Pirellulales bacterium]
MATHVPASHLTPEQDAALEEWRLLCQTLERAQGDHLVQNCREKYQYAKTYMVYGREMDHTAIEVKQASMRGDFSFFTDRGISAHCMTALLADHMMKSWRVSIASKRAFVADMFMKRFGEDIEEFIGTPHNASRLIMAVSFDQRDAILGLAEWTQNKLAAAEIAHLRADVTQLRQQIEHLSQLITDRLNKE